MNIYLDREVKKISISVRMYNRDRLKDVKNKSAFINEAIDLYFNKLDYLKDSQENRLYLQKNPYSPSTGT